ncbi:MAG: CBS domain-containing protein [Nitrospiraceae bacterium]|nr:CBS domain-containing protein [Nitrospiraceae bacterium]
MTVRQHMKKDIATVSPNATLREAAIKMKEKKIGSILVAEEGWKLKGILTDRDIAIALAAEGKDPQTTMVHDIMVQAPITIEADADLDSALRIMNRASVRRLPVLENGRLVGVISSADLACAVKEELNQFIGLEESYTSAKA